VALEKETGIKALRYDRTVKIDIREGVREEFKKSPAAVPLFITAGARGVGLNITDASIVIQGEIWWNYNLELQAQSRCHRQGQKKTVKVFKLVGQASLIDAMISACSRRKTAVNERLIGPLLRGHDVPVSIPEIAETRGFPPLF
jgi:DNA repair and recombination protein RAD54B